MTTKLAKGVLCFLRDTENRKCGIVFCQGSPDDDHRVEIKAFTDLIQWQVGIVDDMAMIVQPEGAIVFCYDMELVPVDDLEFNVARSSRGR